jgi:hypothetical protein
MPVSSSYRLHGSSDSKEPCVVSRPKDTNMTEHEHRHVIIVGHAPITMMAGATLDDKRACACGDTITIGYYLYDPKG